MLAPNQTKRTYSICFTPEKYQELRGIAGKYGLNPSQLIAQLIDQWGEIERLINQK